MKTEYGSVIPEGALFMILAILVAAGMIFLYRRRMRRTMEQMSRMLDAAMEGHFREAHFDESLLSSLETKLAHYLTASEISAEHVKEEKEKIKELLGDISHQTKTPIANLMLYSQLLEEQVNMLEESGKTDESQQMLLSVKAISGQAEKLKFLIESLVKTSRLENGVLALRPEANEVGELIQRAVEQARPKAEARKLRLEAAGMEPPAGTLFFDLKWTVEALYNLLDNAVKYSDEGKTVTVKAYSYSMFYRIDITDEGILIPADEQEKIFQRFYRGKAVSEQEGVGIGLYITRQIVSSQGGYLKVTSGKKGETTFSMYLPVK